MPDEHEADPAPPPPPLEPTGPALVVWNWYNTEIAGKVPSVASLVDADTHLRAKIPALIASLEQKA